MGVTAERGVGEQGLGQERQEGLVAGRKVVDEGRVVEGH